MFVGYRQERFPLGNNDCNEGLLVLINRVAAARGLLRRFGIDALLFTDLKDIRYQCGFTGSEGLLLVGAGETFLLTDSRYTTQAREETSGCDVIEFREKKAALASLAADMGFQSLGFQDQQVTVSFYNELLETMPGVRFIPLGAAPALQRIIKDSREIKSLEKVAGIASESFLEVLRTVRPGDTERDVSIRLEFALRTAGADDKAFEFIVASGVRGALPHGRATTKTIRSGELVTIDFGALLDGYNSDETVTIAIGEPDGKQRLIYQVVKDAHDKALDAIRPGAAFRDIDAVARDYIARQGFGDFFGHGLGHGVGLDVHEKPVVSFRSEEVVREGMVFTIEPGIYLPGWGGVRIEDMVVATTDGCRVLSRVPKGLMVL